MRYHIIGSLGTSLSGIATLLRAEGHTVTGSDERTTGHGADRLPVVLDVVIYSEAVTPGSAGWPELEAARARGVPCLRRIEFIARRMVEHTGIAVAGAHGKSTTTALIGWILAEARTDPTVFIGADLPAFGGSGRSGQGRFVVAEACEWNRQFLALHPAIFVVTSMDREHLDTYPGGEAEIQAAFHQAASQVPATGVVIGNADDSLARSTLTDLSAPIRWVGRAVQATDRISEVEQPADGPLRFKLVPSGSDHVELVSPLVGVHHATNVALAFVVATALGLDRSITSAAIASFPGLKRRFERIRDDATLVVIDDYAHHSAEVAATLEAARARYPHRRQIVVFQPHLSERTTDLLPHFIAALTRADHVFIPATYEPAGRHRRPDAVTSDGLAEAVTTHGGRAVATGELAPTVNELRAILKPGDVVLTLGATDVWTVAEALRDWQPGETAPLEGQSNP